jgi:hypothetical protein
MNIGFDRGLRAEVNGHCEQSEMEGDYNYKGMNNKQIAEEIKAIITQIHELVLSRPIVNVPPNGDIFVQFDQFLVDGIIEMVKGIKPTKEGSGKSVKLITLTEDKMNALIDSAYERGKSDASQDSDINMDYNWVDEEDTSKWLESPQMESIDKFENLEEGDVLITEDGQVFLIKEKNNDIYMLQIEYEIYPIIKGRQMARFEELKQLIKNQQYLSSKELKQLIEKNNFRHGLDSSKAKDLIVNKQLDWKEAKEYLNGLEVNYRGETYFFRKDVERFITGRRNKKI